MFNYGQLSYYYNKVTQTLTTFIGLISIILFCLITVYYIIFRSNFLEKIKGFILRRYDHQNQEDHSSNLPERSQRLCKICDQPPQFEVESSCKHLFCAHCIVGVTFWRSQNKMLHCPDQKCMKNIKIFYFNFPLYQVTDSSVINCIQEIKTYNYNFAEQKRNIVDIIVDTPFLLRRTWHFIKTQEGIHFLFNNLFKSHIIFILVFYILSPFDLIPEIIMDTYIGFLDDAFIIGIILIIIGDIYYNYQLRKVEMDGKLLWDLQNKKEK